jgi:hypothetical protein
MLLTIALALLALVVLFALFARQRQSRASENSGVASGNVEAKKNTLRGEVHSLELGIRQVQGYIDHLKGEEEEIKEARSAATAELLKASELKGSIEAAIETSTTEAQVDGLALGLEQARSHVRKARSLSLHEQHQEDDEDK